MSNYNTQLQSNNIDLQTVLQTLQTKAANGEQATPVISVNTSGLITATAGTKFSTHQLAFQPAKTITPSTASQIAVSSGYYTGGNVTVAGDANLIAENIKSGVSIFGVSGNYSSPQLEPVLQDKTISKNGVYTADSNFDGLGTVTVDVKNIETEQVEWSENEDAIISRTLSSYTNDRVTTIGCNAFYSCRSLTSVSFPVCTTIDSYAFAFCSSLTSVNFPVCTTISRDAFRYCSSLTSVSFPVCSTIGNQAFYSCRSLTSVSFPVCTTIGNTAFNGCDNLTSVSFPVCTTIGYHAFAYCRSLTSVSFPVCTTISYNAFYSCRSLTSVSFPVCTTIGDDAFNGCRSLTSVSFPACTTIGYNAFCYCYNLKSLYLTGSSLCTLSNSKTFTSTPIGGYSTSAGTYGSIYVPASLLTSYQTATNWTYFSSRFVAYDSGDSRNLITFTIDDTEYQAEEGMTWGEWVESEYNTIGAVISEDYIMEGYITFNTNYYICDIDYVHSSHTINENYNYIIYIRGSIN